MMTALLTTTCFTIPVTYPTGKYETRLNCFVRTLVRSLVDVVMVPKPSTVEFPNIFETSRVLLESLHVSEWKLCIFT